MLMSGVGYPERFIPHAGKLEEWAGRAVGPLARRFRSVIFHRDEWIRRIAAEGEEYGRMGDAGLKLASQALRPMLVRHGFRHAHYSLAIDRLGSSCRHAWRETQRCSNPSG